MAEIELVVRKRKDVATELVVSPRVVLSGSYRRDPAGLQAIFNDLRGFGCEIVSPGSVEFVVERDGFAMQQSEIDSEPHSIEELHLDAIRSSDFVWLHAPDGYIGPSASLEIGFAHAFGIPVFCSTTLADPVVASFVAVVASPEQAVLRSSEELIVAPGAALRTLQLYYGVQAKRRGYAHETAQDTMLLLTEELGELARAVRRHVGLDRSGGFSTEEVGEEVADVQLYLVHLANVLGADLGGAVTEKERINDQRRREGHTRSA